MLTQMRGELYKYIAHPATQEARDGLDFKTKKHLGNYWCEESQIDMEIWRIDGEEFSKLTVFEVRYLRSVEIEIKSPKNRIWNINKETIYVTAYYITSKEMAHYFLGLK